MSETLGVSLRILIVDDCDLIRRGIVGLLRGETSWAICGEARSSREAVEKAHATVPDVVLLDVNLPDAKLSETAHLIRQRAPQASLVMMSANSPAVISVVGHQAGVHAWLDKSRIASDLVPIIRKLSNHT